MRALRLLPAGDSLRPKTFAWRSSPHFGLVLKAGQHFLDGVDDNAIRGPDARLDRHVGVADEAAPEPGLIFSRCSSCRRSSRLRPGPAWGYLARLSAARVFILVAAVPSMGRSTTFPFPGRCALRCRSFQGGELVREPLNLLGDFGKGLLSVSSGGGRSSARASRSTAASSSSTKKAAASAAVNRVQQCVQGSFHKCVLLPGVGSSAGRCRQSGERCSSPYPRHRSLRCS